MRTRHKHHYHGLQSLKPVSCVVELGDYNFANCEFCQLICEIQGDGLVEPIDNIVHVQFTKAELDELLSSKESSLKWAAKYGLIYNSLDCEACHGAASLVKHHTSVDGFYVRCL